MSVEKDQTNEWSWAEDATLGAVRRRSDESGATCRSPVAVGRVLYVAMESSVRDSAWLRVDEHGIDVYGCVLPF